VIYFANATKLYRNTIFIIYF